MADNAQKVRDIIEKELGVEREKLTDEASFIEDLGADSLAVVEIVLAFEGEFGVDIPDEVARDMVTVGDVIAFVQQHAACGPCASLALAVRRRPRSQSPSGSTRGAIGASGRERPVQ